MTRRTQTNRFTPQLLALESRDVPAGNVTASLSGSTLEVFGDDADNLVVLRGHGSGVVEVRGSDTTVNGGKRSVTFVGVSRVRVLAADGDDRVATRGLVLDDLFVSGGTGDDVIRVEDTTNAGGALAIVVLGDTSGPGGTQASGTDAITVTGTNVRGGGVSFYFQGDDPLAGGPGGRDRIALTDTRIDAPQFDLYVASDGASDPGNVIAIENLTAAVAGGAFDPTFTIEGGTGDDTVRLRGIDFTYHSEFDTLVIFVIGTGDGEDVIDAVRVSIESTSGTDEAGNAYFNSTDLYLIADSVRLTDARLVGGAVVNHPVFGLGYTGGSIRITGTVVDVRDVTLPGNGFAGLYVESMEAFDGVERDDRWSLVNVRATSANGLLGELTLDSSGGNDTVRVRDSSFESVAVRLGDGDDSLTLVNTAGATPYADFGFGGIDAGGGNDAVSLVRCTFPSLPIDLGDGDDVLRLRKNTFGTAELFGGSGTDQLYLRANTGSLNPDEFDD